jgi:hypothetical protein
MASSVTEAVYRAILPKSIYNMFRFNAREQIRQKGKPISLELAPMTGLQFADSSQVMSVSTPI